MNDATKCSVCGNEIDIADDQLEVICPNCGNVTSKVPNFFAKGAYEVFISCRSVSDTGQPTMDSRVAKEAYDKLVSKGYEVFYAPETTSDNMLASDALGEARILVVIGTNTRNFNDATVKSEWQQYLTYMKEDSSKRIIPCYRDLPYDLPDDLIKFDSLDISGAWFLDDLVKRVSSEPEKKKTIELGANINDISIEYVNEEDVTTPDTNNVVVSDEVLSALLGPEVIIDDKETKEQNFESTENDIATKKEATTSNFSSPVNRNAPSKFGRVNVREYKTNDTKVLAYLTLLVVLVILLIAFLIATQEEHYYNPYGSTGYDNYDIPYEYEDDYEEEIVVDYEQEYQLALDLSKSKKRKETFVAFSKLGDYKDSKEKAEELYKKYVTKPRKNTIAFVDGYLTVAETDFFVGIKSNGKIATAGEVPAEFSEIYKWNGIISVEGGDGIVVGLRKDGTVVCAHVYHDDVDVSKWKNIVAISVGEDHVVGLRKDGTVVSSGYDFYGETKLDDWKDIVNIAAGDGITVGVKRDGTIVSKGSNIMQAAGRYDFESRKDWYGIIDVIFGYNQTFGIRADGTIVVIGNYLQDDEDWKDIVAISSFLGETIGLKSNGEVVLDSSDSERKTTVESWKKISAISIGTRGVVGLKKNGEVLFVDADGGYEEGFSKWKNIKQ